MREIAFRAWYNKKMYYFVEHVSYTDGSSGIGCVGYDEHGRIFSPDDDEVELMQFSGLKDFKGKKIWEGDVLFWNRRKGEVFWDQDFAAWRARNIGSLGGIPNLEIVGNRYEHPELVEATT